MSIFGWSYPPGCSGTPFDEDFEDDVCAWCGQDVDPNAKPGNADGSRNWHFYGFCDANCAAHQLLADMGIAHGAADMNEDQELLLDAVATLAAGGAK